MPETVTAYVLDTGVDPSLADEFPHVRLQPGFNLSRHGSPDDSSDPHGHGTAVARTLLAACRTATVRLVPIRLLDRRGALWERSRVADALERILRELPEGPAVVCAAFGDGRHLLPDEPDGEPAAAERIRELRRRGVAFVAAAGNFYAAARQQRRWGMCWPASCPDAVSVGAAVFVPEEGRQREGDGASRDKTERIASADGEASALSEGALAPREAASGLSEGAAARSEADSILSKAASGPSEGAAARSEADSILSKAASGPSERAAATREAASGLSEGAPASSKDASALNKDASALSEAASILSKGDSAPSETASSGRWLLEPNSQRVPSASACGGTTLFAPAHPPGHTSGAAAFAAGRLAAVCSRYPGINVDEQLVLLLSGAASVPDGEDGARWPLLL
ncbi:S8 family serine peptidase [Paenibacillus albicereus]|uniref:S8 family serine peptidase n=1 Tax=Paenibacillus albicereus TaxID=2726185 RepID=A0A6H2GZ33_9BACL|nr:S8 family serine peptidase [Paenibacillus albicereus]QJC52694.1 S8 family serine peptidase [Paenibacillus albicereus]